MREGGERPNPVDQEQMPAMTEPDSNEEMSPEKQEEHKLRSKYGAGNLPAKGQSQFLQKRLQQRKFFDSGDYNMAKAKGLKLPPGIASGAKPPPPSAAAAAVTTRKQPALNVVVDEEPPDGSTSPTGVEIPTPATVPQRKSSIIYPTASKLSPQPLHHHTPESLTATLES